MLQGLTHLAREARPWTFAEARNVLARVLRVRLDDAERDFAATLIEAGKAREAVATLPALAKTVVFQCGYGATGLPHLGTFGEAGGGHRRDPASVWSDLGHARALPAAPGRH